MKIKTRWEGGGTYLSGECDIPTCSNKPNWRNWEKDPFGMNGDDELLASLCNDHTQYKAYETTEKIIEQFEKDQARNDLENYMVEDANQ